VGRETRGLLKVICPTAQGEIFPTTLASMRLSDQLRSGAAEDGFWRA
jgi:hypothetical protein